MCQQEERLPQMTTLFSNPESALNNNIDIAVVFTVKDANPNGDPLNGNLPRQDPNGLGEVVV